MYIVKGEQVETSHWFSLLAACTLNFPLLTVIAAVLFYFVNKRWFLLLTPPAVATFSLSTTEGKL